MAKQVTYPDFLTRFPDDNAVLDDIFTRVYGDLQFCPDCGAKTKFHRVASRKCYECAHCGFQLYPLAKTPLRDTKLRLTHWYFAIFLFSVSKNGVSAKELQRQIGVSYPTAFRMGHIIRGMMNEHGEVTLSGVIELDETLIGGKKRGGKRGWGSENKKCVFGMVERGGKIITRVVPNREHDTLLPIICENTTEDCTGYTDEFAAYKKLTTECLFDGHGTVMHKEKQHINGEAHTQTIDGHWSIVKRSIRGTHTHVYGHLQKYLDEFDFRRNHRAECLFDALIKRVS